MKKLVTTALLAVGLAAPIVAMGPSAQADTPGCVSRSEFRSVSKGMKIARVERKFDTKGKTTLQGYGMKFKEYKPCPDPTYGFVTVDYKKKNGTFVVTGKFAYWG